MLKSKEKTKSREILGVNYETIRIAAEERIKAAINDLEYKAKCGSVGLFFKAIVGYETAREECLRTKNGLYNFNGNMDALKRGKNYIKRVEEIMQEVGGSKYWSN